ncbi:serine/threonine protein kinase, partial [Bacteroides ovatus]
RLYRSVRKFFSWEPHISRFLLKKEKHIYDTYLCKYDYCELLSADYQ